MSTTPIRVSGKWFPSSLGSDHTFLIAAAVVESASAVEMALRLVEAEPPPRVDLFEHSWTAVDLRRSQLRLAGIADRVDVHHVSSLMCASVLSAIAAEGPILLFPN
jgi:hypothetical protein